MEKWKHRQSCPVHVWNPFLPCIIRAESWVGKYSRLSCHFFATVVVRNTGWVSQVVGEKMVMCTKCTQCVSIGIQDGQCHLLRIFKQKSGFFFCSLMEVTLLVLLCGIRDWYLQIYNWSWPIRKNGSHMSSKISGNQPLHRGPWSPSWHANQSVCWISSFCVPQTRWILPSATNGNVNKREQEAIINTRLVRVQCKKTVDASCNSLVGTDPLWLGCHAVIYSEEPCSLSVSFLEAENERVEVEW